MQVVAISVTLVVLVLFLIGFIISIVLIGICTSRQRIAEFRAQVEHRRNELRQAYLLEQEDWRSRRLQDVVLLLIQRGEVVEGIPLAAQIPGRDEVLCRRKIRQSRRRCDCEELMDEVREEQERGVYSSPVRQTIHMTLDELLAHGRPPEAEAGPDIMQLLLDGQEPHELSSNNGDSESENDENNSEYWVDETQQNTHVPSLATSPLELQPANELSQSPPHHHHDQHPLSADNDIDSNTHNQRAAVMNDDQNEQQSHEEQHHENNNNENNTNNTTTVMTEAEARHARWVEERQAAILRELHAEQARRNRRRRTSEEVYGVGVPYLVNPNNTTRDENVINDKEISIIAINESGEEEPQSPIMRFLSPMSPFRNRNKRKTETSVEMSSPGVPERLTLQPIREQSISCDFATREFSSPATSNKTI